MSRGKTSAHEQPMSIQRNTLWNFLGSITPMFLGFVTIPYLIKEMELEAFGILTLVWALIGYFGVFDFGIGRALTYQVSSNRSNTPSGKVPSIIKNGLLTVAVFGVIGGLVLAMSAHQFGFKWLNVSPSLQQSTASCLLIASLGIPLTTIMTGLRGVLEGFEDFRTTNILRVILGFANFGLPAVSAMLLGPSLEYMVASLVAARLAILVAHWITVDARISHWADLKHFDKETMKEQLSFGTWMTLSNIVSPLMVTADRFIISGLLGASVVAFYTVPFDVIVRLLVVPAALTVAVFPRFSHLLATDLDAFRRVYRKCFVVMLWVMLPLCVLIGTGSFAGLSFWLGREFAESSWLITSILSLGLLFNGLAQIPHAAIQASGNVRATALLHLTEFVLYVPLLYGALKVFGLVGAAIVWVARVLFDLLILLVISNEQMKRTCFRIQSWAER